MPSWQTLVSGWVEDGNAKLAGFGEWVGRKWEEGRKMSWGFGCFCAQGMVAAGLLSARAG